MLVIRFFRTGKKGQAFFKIVVTEKQKAPTKGRFVEEVGFYNPLTKEKSVKAERVKYWLSVGAQPSPTVYNLLISEKVIEDKKISVHAKPKKKEEKPAEVQQAPVEAPKEKKKEEVKEEKTAPEVKAEPVEVKPQQEEEKLKEDKPSSRPSPSKEGSEKEEAPKTE